MPELVNQTYKLTAPMGSYQHPEITITPSFCPLAVNYVVTPLSAGNTAISLSSATERTFEWYYSGDDKPISPVLQK